MKVSYPKGSFPVTANLIAPRPVIKCVVSSVIESHSQVLVDNTELWQYVVSEISRKFLTNNLRGVYVSQTWHFILYLVAYGFWEKPYSMCRIIPYKITSSHKDFTNIFTVNYSFSQLLLYPIFPPLCHLTLLHHWGDHSYSVITERWVSIPVILLIFLVLS